MALHIPRDADVMAADGVVGRVRYVVVDPASGDATNLVVGDQTTNRLVPISQVSAVAGGRVALRGDRAAWQALPLYDPAAFTIVGDTAGLDGGSSDVGPATDPFATAQADGALALQGPQRLVLRAEQMVATRQTVLLEEVVISKRIITDTRTIVVPVRREELVIERVPRSRLPADAAQPVVGQVGVGEDTREWRLVLREEVPDVTFRTVIREEVVITKRPLDEVKRVTETVRREVVRPQIEGEVTLHDDNEERPAPAPLISD